MPKVVTRWSPEAIAEDVPDLVKHACKFDTDLDDRAACLSRAIHMLAGFLDDTIFDIVDRKTRRRIFRRA